MKKLMEVIVVVVSVCFSLVATAKGEGWREYPQSKNSPLRMTYSAKVQGGYCSVSVDKDGKVLVLLGIDHNWYGKTVFHSVAIFKKGDAVFYESSAYEEEHSSVGSRRFEPRQREGGYNVFCVKCLPITKKLPKDVRQKFFGYGGIE